MGQALKRNPNAPKVPCHRVTSSDLTPGCFMGRREGTAMRRKLDLLAQEYVRFHAGKLTEPGRLFCFRITGRMLNSDFPASLRLCRASCFLTSDF